MQPLRAALPPAALLPLLVVPGAGGALRLHLHPPALPPLPRRPLARPGRGRGGRAAAARRHRCAGRPGSAVHCACLGGRRLHARVAGHAPAAQRSSPARLGSPGAGLRLRLRRPQRAARRGSARPGRCWRMRGGGEEGEGGADVLGAGPAPTCCAASPSPPGPAGRRPGSWARRARGRRPAARCRSSLGGGGRGRAGEAAAQGQPLQPGGWLAASA
jgi:hypothetical protein